MKSSFIIAILVIAFSFSAIGQNTLPNRYTAYEPNYFLTNFGQDYYGQIKFKVSFKYDLLIPSKENKIYFAYTQFAFWDIYKPSAPMRELDFTPMLFYQRTFHKNQAAKADFISGFNYIRIGYLHQSDGKSDSTNRSLFKLFIHASYKIENNRNNSCFKIKTFELHPQAWIWNMLASQNSNIADYQGYGQLISILNFDFNRLSTEDVYPLTLNTVIIPAKKTTSIVANISVNPFIKNVHTAWIPNIYFQYWNGYGESLINYDNRLNNYRRLSELRLGVQFRVK